MPKRFSGDVRLTLVHGVDALLREDDFSVKVKAPGCKPYNGCTSLETGYIKLHGMEASLDEAARRHLLFLEQNFPIFVKKAVRKNGVYHVGRGKADRWPGGSSNTKTKRGRSN